MLILTRKKNEGIVINRNIRVSVVEIRGDQVRLGIEAPPFVSVNRDEIQAKINQEEQENDEQPPS